MQATDRRDRAPDGTSLERAVSPRGRSTRALVLGLDDRAFAGVKGGGEWLELRRRIADMMSANASGDSHASAADVCSMLFGAGLDERPGAVKK